jgi:hypothetical protein
MTNCRRIDDVFEEKNFFRSQKLSIQIYRSDNDHQKCTLTLETLITFFCRNTI